MFKNKALRAVAGMLFGSVGGILWGAWFNAAKSAALVLGDEAAHMNALLDSIMFGSGIGFLIGLVIGLARNSMVTGIATGFAGMIVVYLPPGFPLEASSTMRSALLWGAGIVGGLALALAALVPKKAP